MKWRVVNTDTEGPTGIAPVCEQPEHPEHAGISGLRGEAALGTGGYVFNCCPYPQLELWDEDAAAKTAVRFTELEAKVAGT